jgi:hypothetical protein
MPQRSSLPVMNAQRVDVFPRGRNAPHEHPLLVRIDHLRDRRTTSRDRASKFHMPRKVPLSRGPCDASPGLR